MPVLVADGAGRVKGSRLDLDPDLVLDLEPEPEPEPEMSPARGRRVPG
jgi:hypothetical protein